MTVHFGAQEPPQLNDTGVISAEEFSRKPYGSLPRRRDMPDNVTFSLCLAGLIVIVTVAGALTCALGSYLFKPEAAGLWFRASTFLPGVAAGFFLSEFLNFGVQAGLALRYNLIGGKAPSWVLTHPTWLKRVNSLYLKSKLNDRHREAAQALASDFTGNLSELIMVSKALD